MQNLVEWFGYSASVVVAVSLLMSSLVKLRWINLVGSSMFSAYGAIIGAYPVAVLNFAIACINVYYLVGFYRQKDQFKLVEVSPESSILAEFLSVHAEGIRVFFPSYPASLKNADRAFVAMRNGQLAGVILSSLEKPGTMRVWVDYVTPAYRDFKIGHFVYERNLEVFRRLGIKTLVGKAEVPEHGEYLERMGFVSDAGGEPGMFVRTVV